jgi:putative two-component system response regulator
MAQHIGLPEETAEEICLASAMHDVGKIGIPDSILLKPGKLSEKEFEEMKFHTEIGANILRGADSDILKVAEEISLTRGYLRRFAEQTSLQTAILPRDHLRDN